MKKEQKPQVLSYLKKHKTITPLQALSKFGCYRLSSIINRLRNDGYKIITILTDQKKGGNKYAKYKLQ